MHASRAQAPSIRRLGAGLAAAAVLTAGLACAGTATAAELADFPQSLDFELTDLATTADDVYAVGHVGVDADDDGQFEEIDGYVRAVGSGAQLHLGDGTWPTAVSASPDGTTLQVVGTRTDEALPENGSASWRWTVDTATMDVTDQQTVEGHGFDDVASGTAGTYVAWTDGEGSAGVTLPSGLSVPLGTSLRVSELALMPTGEDVDVVVGASDWQQDSSSIATLRTITADGLSAPTVLGPDGDPDHWINGLDVDEVNNLTYVVSMRDVADGPQQYGLNVIGPDTDVYVPLPYPVFSVAVSADGETVYLPGNSIAAYDADALDSYSDENYPPSTYLGGSGWIEHAVVDPAGRLYVAQDHQFETGDTYDSVTRVHAIEAPGAPTGLRAVPSEWATDTLVATWARPAGLGGASEDSLSYKITLQDQAGGEPVVDETWMTEREISGLQAGHTYTLSVVTSNGAFSSAPATTTFTAAAPLAHPSAVAVRGKLAVGSRLSVASTGSWATGTALSHVWRSSTGQVLSRASTLSLGKGHLGMRIRVEVTGAVSGSASSTVSSAYGAKVARGTLASRVPSITGKAKVRRTLTARPGSWTTGTSFKYRWTANGRVVKGATSRKLKLNRAVVGKRIRVVVTGTKPGYAKVARTSKTTAKVRR